MARFKINIKNFKGSMVKSFGDVTELPEQKASGEQLNRLYTRYKFASQFCKEKKVLELACGAGLGLGLLAKEAGEVVAGDIDEKILEYAEKTYKNQKKIRIMQIDAGKKLNFRDNSFDVVILYEVIYFIPNSEKLIKEIHRILKKNGIFLMCLPNKNLKGFHRAYCSTKYFSVPELNKLLEEFEDVKIYGNCQVDESLGSRLISLVKIIAVKLNLIPKTMKGKEFFKRIFFGRLEKIPGELKDKQFSLLGFKELDNNKVNKDYKVIFASAKK